ncbi:30S ribosomal protein S16 [Coxiella endosymbiont of Amblyomma americanum]|uniref:30S ribosomal protein S16 n=1 Tax=Coxiella endosymbiont of Amblyomma americanum TaxID=325775 RepID=UPI000581C5A6|nr:30S ribosomal protein S16 [Coxiella endosymbiont of Amblyomma americanum]AJC50494.1 ribosomal protein S16 [Coxiella endosymbiont of Amblyomma americanum]AUJ58831.1 30S ribosomal protein S16 [Coxiella-like endosymbiont of Amblyomma americanum]
MIIIRLTRKGRKKCPFYQIVVADRRAPRDGRFIEQLGYYNPAVARRKKCNSQLQIKQERASYWITQGATVSVRVKCLLKQFKRLSEDITETSIKKHSNQLTIVKVP